MFDIRAELIKEMEKLRVKYDIQQKKIDDAGYSKDDLGDSLNKMAEQDPILDRLWVREQLQSRIRGLEKVMQIIEKEN